MKESVFTIRTEPGQGQNIISHTVDEALDIIGRGKFQYYVFLSCGIFLMATIVESMGVSFILSTAQCELELDTFRKGALTSVTFFGIAITSHISGFLTDEYGRKRTVFISLTVSMIFSFCAALAPHFWLVFALRLLTGMSISAASTGIYAYLSEFFPAQERSAAIAYACSVGSLNTIYIACVGLLITHYGIELPITDNYTISGWRLHMIINLVPGVLALFLMRSLPESPKYLMMMDRVEESLYILRTMYETNTGKSRFSFPVQRLTSGGDLSNSSGKESSKTMKGFLSAMTHETKLIFSPPHLGLILSCCFIQFGCFAMAGGLGLWFPELSNRISMGANDIGLCEIISWTSEGINSTILTLTSANCEVVVNPEMYTNTIVLAVVYGVCFILLGIGLNKVSLKNTLTGIMILGMICAVVLQHITEINLLLAIFVFLIICAGVAIPMVNATAVDLFPTNLRGMAISMTILIGRMGTVAGANSIGFLLDVNCSVTFYGIALLALACAIFSACLPKKNHKQLQQTVA